MRDEVIDFVATWSPKAELPAKLVVKWLALQPSKYFDWKKRRGQANEDNATVPRDHWLEQAERDAIVQFAREHPLDGYRRQTLMRLEADVAYVSPAAVYRVLSQAGLLSPWKAQPSKKGPASFSPRSRTTTGTQTSRT